MFACWLQYLLLLVESVPYRLEHCGVFVYSPSIYINEIIFKHIKAQVIINKGSIQMVYTPIHGCNKGPCKQQIITIIIFLAQLALHSVFVVPEIFDVQKQWQRYILIIILAFFYALLILICYDYMWISCHDPADRILFHPDRMQAYDLEELDDCSQCGKKQITSYHCNRCGRCTQDFDHHCKFLNSCIGGLNYENFLRLLLTNIIYGLVCIGQGAWVFVSQVQHLWKWGIVILFVVTTILLILVSILLIFHCYISCCINMTTLDWMFYEPEEIEQRKSRQSRIMNIKNIETERYLNRN